MDKHSWQRMNEQRGMEVFAWGTSDLKGSIAVFFVKDEAGNWEIVYTRNGMMMCQYASGSDWADTPKGDPI